MNFRFLRSVHLNVFRIYSFFVISTPEEIISKWILLQIFNKDALIESRIPWFYRNTMTLDRSIVRLSILLFVMCTWRNSVIGKQQFIEKPPLYQEVASGDDVQLQCKIRDKRGNCIWQKDRRPVGMQADKYEWASGGSDCTLLIRRATLHFDDGFWECQVTSSDFVVQDALSSEQSRLLVRGEILTWSVCETHYFRDSFTYKVLT